MNHGGEFLAVHVNRNGRQPLHPRGALAVLRSGPEGLPVRPPPVWPRTGAVIWMLFSESNGLILF